MAVYIGVLAYAIVRHKLLNIEVIVKKTLVFAGLLAVVFGILVVPVLIIQEYAARQIDFTGRLVGLAISGIIIIFAIKKIEAFLVEITDKFLFQKKYSYKELLKTFSGEVLTVLEMDKLLDITVSKLSEIIKLHNCAILVFDENSGAFRCQTSTDATMRGAVVPKKLLGDLKGHILRSELGAADSTTLDVMDKFKAGLLIPLAFHDRPIALLALGNKKSDEDYTKDDLDILIPLGQTLAIAISNAKLFDELAKKRSELAQKDKMATIGTLAAGMAHEIRNPITTIRTFADFLPEKYDDSAFMQKFSKLIPLEIERVDTIARSLLEFSSESNMATEREAVDLAGVIRKNIELLRPQYKLSDINVSFDTGERARLEANAQQINDAIFYIVKYIYAESPKNADVSVAALAGANTAEVRFVISARIITDHVIKDIFDPVSETRPEKRGFGFELFIAKRLIEKNDGVFSIYVDPAARTEFRIDFR